MPTRFKVMVYWPPWKSSGWIDAATLTAEQISTLDKGNPECGNYSVVDTAVEVEGMYAQICGDIEDKKTADFICEAVNKYYETCQLFTATR